MQRIGHQGDDGGWEFVVRPPRADLRPHVFAVEGYEERMRGPVRQRHLPSTLVPLILNFGPP